MFEDSTFNVHVNSVVYLKCTSNSVLAVNDLLRSRGPPRINRKDVESQYKLEYNCRLQNFLRAIAHDIGN